MSAKIFFLLLTICGLCFDVHSQEVVTGGKTNNTSAVKTISADEAAKNALNVGAKMPLFSLKDQNGKTIESRDLLKQGNLVIVFYRGSWCPFCNLYLRNLQKNLAQIKAAGGNLIAVSVENPDNSLTVAKKNELAFTVLSDPNLAVARSFGIVYEMPKETTELYKSRGLDVAEHNRMEKAELPLSATYVVNQKGKIVYAFLEPDYKKRAEPQVIIEMLSKIKSSIVKLANIANITVAPIKVK
jgi:peroxiredoxin